MATMPAPWSRRRARGVGADRDRLVVTTANAAPISSSKARVSVP